MNEIKFDFSCWTEERRNKYCTSEVNKKTADLAKKFNAPKKDERLKADRIAREISRLNIAQEFLTNIAPDILKAHADKTQKVSYSYSDGLLSSSDLKLFRMMYLRPIMTVEKDSESTYDFTWKLNNPMMYPEIRVPVRPEPSEQLKVYNKYRESGQFCDVTFLIEDKPFKATIPAEHLSKPEQQAAGVSTEGLSESDEPDLGQVEDKNSIKPTKGQASINSESTSYDPAGIAAFKGHKVVMAGFSDFFEALFISGKNTGGCFDLTSEKLTGAVFEKLLQFAYGQRITLKELNLPELLSLAAFAHKIQCIDLYKLCHNKIAGRIWGDNFKEILDFALQVNESGIKTTCRRFIYYNPDWIAHEDSLLV